MNINRNALGVLIPFSLYCVICTIICLIILSNPILAIGGIFIGYLIALTNWFILNLTVRWLFNLNRLLAVQFMIFRLLIYILGAWVCTQLGFQSVLLFAIVITGFSLVIFVEFGLKGGLCFVKHK